MGLEYALLTASITLQATNITHGPSLSLSMAFVWLSAMLLRTNSRKAERFQHWPRRAKDAFSTLGKTISIRAQVWFILQILSMTATYYFAFNLMGAELTTNEALALSAITILASVLMFVPNGLGITDSLWFFIAINRGLTVETAAALAIMIRLSHLTSSLIIYLAGKLKLSSIKLDN